MSRYAYNLQPKGRQKSFYGKKYNGKRYRMWATSFSNLCDALIKYEFLKKNSGYPRGSEVQLRMYDINSQKWKWLGDWEDL